ncbi:MAG: sugar transferase [Balneolaceae bacterium]|nr:MAG: sugar transferase [Balneolaceae bacterium]
MGNDIIKELEIPRISSTKVDSYQASLKTFFLKHLDPLSVESLRWMDSNTDDDIPEIKQADSGLVNTHRINDIRYVNKFFEKVNREMENDRYFVIVLETMHSRRKRILNKFPRVISYPYYVLDFILKRVLPKTKPTRKIYFAITKGRNRVISLTEALGRLTCCGFEIIAYQSVGYHTCIITRKVKPPAYDMQPTYGALVKLNRIGRNGKFFRVYKVRTMYPYSEYLQDYVFDKFDLEQGGKIRNDFRMTTWGSFLRKYWLDELPMFINFFMGDMKLVGVRPLSEHYFNLYPEDLRMMRIITKPGLIPPYYADMPNGLEEIQASERRYLEQYNKHPIRTDLKYLGKVFINIAFRGARSK